MEDINVLVIEDDPKAAGVLEDTLKQAGYKVWMVDHPKRGLELAQQMTFATVVTELRFAGMNGVELSKAMSQLSPETSVVVVTAFISSAVEAMEAGAYGYVTKPFNPAEVRIVVQRAAERFALLSTQTEKRRYAELSVTDGLTGAFNRRSFDLYLTQQVSARGRHPTDRFSLLMIDLDDFKRYNDTRGHLAGDELLQQLARVLRESIRQGDMAFRYGGEEFVIVLGQADKKDAVLIAERLRHLVQLYTSATISIGASSYPEDGADGPSLVGRADAALYAAKEAGKNRVCLA